VRFSLVGDILYVSCGQPDPKKFDESEGLDVLQPRLGKSLWHIEKAPWKVLQDDQKVNILLIYLVSIIKY